MTSRKYTKSVRSWIEAAIAVSETTKAPQAQTAASSSSSRGQPLPLKMNPIYFREFSILQKYLTKERQLLQDRTLEQELGIHFAISFYWKIF